MAPMDAIWLTYVAFSRCHFAATSLPTPWEQVLAILATPVTASYLKWWEIQLAIHSIVGEWIDYK